MPRSLNGVLDASNGLAHRFVLPYAHDLPPGRLKASVGIAVPFHVRRQLFRPPGRVRRRHRAMGRTSVPKATIDENCNARTAKDDVRPTTEAADKGGQCRSCLLAPQSPHSALSWQSSFRVEDSRAPCRHSSSFKLLKTRWIHAQARASRFTCTCQASRQRTAAARG